MKLIFLDIDGVLNHIGCKTRTKNGYYFVEDEKVALLQGLIEETGAEVVLSSSWRRGYYDLQSGKDNSDTQDYQQLVEKLREYGIEIVGHTPISSANYRGNEIAEWLEEYGDEVESFLILDDDNDMKPFGQFFVQTSFLKGLTERHIQKGKQILEKMSYPEFRKRQHRKVAESAEGKHARVYGDG